MNYIKKLQAENADLKEQLAAANAAAIDLRNYAASDKFIQSMCPPLGLQVEYIHKNDVIMRTQTILSAIHDV